MKTILTITGSDGTGGSGVQADIRLISQLGGTAASAITSITVQNTLGIQEFHDLPAAVVRQQVEAIINDLQPQIVKIGLVRRNDVVQILAEVLQRYKPQHIIYAPVLTSTKGEQLVEPRVYEAIERLLLPLCTVVLAPSDLPVGPRRHGAANQLGSALAYYLSLNEKVSEAMLHAQTYLKQLPADYTDGNTRTDELYNQFLDTVERYYNRYADVAFYAEQLNVSPRYLGQVTRQVANRSPKAIIDERITTEIAKLITTTNKPLKDVARWLGFSSQAHLSRFFKKRKGVSPRDYQNHKQ
ncbi:bifunctional hydroxymethylpyrimidine kinase/phosphomethylpyrimidine kinase [Prevotella sp. P6B1]|uniref:bifunctional hydroxymethylpyrimidine kinase/phosphomethylpyrimidine kinase n=1 Tax=Prevotella sp. P6B1 TaxID=1410613 RepID=UPI00051C26EF|nr:bifunctional hydroxymethylpyrimidine kinase/phosphomethylpyrimidine kinase [Prevotella sp. P6B1]